jgi:hypothetical protein
MCLPGSTFPTAKAGWNFKLLDNSPGQSVIEPKNGPAVCLPGTTSSKSKAERICKHSHNLLDRIGADITNGPAMYMPGSTSTEAKAGQNSAKNLGNKSLDDYYFLTQPLFSLDDRRPSPTVALLKGWDRQAIITWSSLEPRLQTGRITNLKMIMFLLPSRPTWLIIKHHKQCQTDAFYSEVLTQGASCDLSSSMIPKPILPSLVA